MIKNYYKRGVTFIELLIVFVSIGLLVSVVLPQLFQVRENQALKSAVENVLSTIDRARSRTLASVNSSEYGVHFQSDKVIIFKGKVFSAEDAGNEIINILNPASISNVTFGGVNGESGDVYFNRIYGVPSTTGTITLSISSASKIITIYPTGISGVN